jgi:hypothetical protein
MVASIDMVIFLLFICNEVYQILVV